MANIVDYVRSASATFAEKPLNRVDSLVLSWLSYYPIPAEASAARSAHGMRLARLCRPDWLVDMASPLHDPVQSLDLIGLAAASPRFSPLRVCDYVAETSDADRTQFAAMTFAIPGVGAYVAFRGTDGSLAGWREDFDMAYDAPVPAQDRARRYLERAAREHAGDLWSGGHSKGGNLAVYAGMTADEPTRARLRRVFSHDGPGFNERVLGDPSWRGDAAIVDKTVPTDSFVGLLLATPGAPSPAVVRSSASGALAHAPLSWLVLGDDFVLDRSVSFASLAVSRRFNAWVGGMTRAQRRRFVESLYTLTCGMGVGDVADVSSDVAAYVMRLLGSVDQLAEPARTEFAAQLEELATTMLLGPADDYDRSDETPLRTAGRAAGRVEDSTARFYDRLRDLERRCGGRL